MDTTYEINCVNSTDENYHFVTYQTYPDTTLKSVAWQVAHVPKMEAIPSSGHMAWQLTYGVAIANWKATDQTYTINQEVHANLGCTYEVVMTADGIPSINPEPKAVAEPDRLVLMNNTDEKINLGFTVSHKLIAVQEAVTAEVVIFQKNLTYKVGCFRSMKLQEGQVLTEGVGLEPVDVEFDEKRIKCSVEAVVEGGKHKIHGPDYYTEQLHYTHFMQYTRK